MDINILLFVHLCLKKLPITHKLLYIWFLNQIFPNQNHLLSPQFVDEWARSRNVFHGRGNSKSVGATDLLVREYKTFGYT